MKGRKSFLFAVVVATVSLAVAFSASAADRIVLMEFFTATW